jgi:hypothetical protein
MHGITYVQGQMDHLNDRKRTRPEYQTRTTRRRRNEDKEEEANTNEVF